MNERAERDTYGVTNYASAMGADGPDEKTRDRGQDRRPAPSGARNDHGQAQHSRNTSDDAPTIPQAVVGFIEKNPVVAAGAALAVGAAVAMMVHSRRTSSNRIDRRVQRAVRSMDRTFAREMKSLRNSDMADRLGHFGSSLGDAFSRIDLGPLAERGRFYLDAARRRIGA